MFTGSLLSKWKFGQDASQNLLFIVQKHLFLKVKKAIETNECFFKSYLHIHTTIQY